MLFHHIGDYNTANLVIKSEMDTFIITVTRMDWSVTLLCTCETATLA
jgi:hypothetical protein